MNELEIAVIGTFMDAFKRKDSKISEIPVQLNNQRGWRGTISENVEVKLNLCSLGVAMKNQGLSNLALKTFGDAIQTEGAVEFFLSFLIELQKSNIGMSQIAEKASENASELDIGIHDTELLNRYLKEFKFELQRAIQNAGGVTAFAKAIGLSQPALSKLLHSDSVPRAASLSKIFEALKITKITIRRGETK